MQYVKEGWPHNYDNLKGGITLQTIGGFPHLGKRMPILAIKNSRAGLAKGPSSPIGTLAAFWDT